MLEAIILISGALAVIAVFSIYAGLRAERELIALKKKQEIDNAKIKDLGERVDVLKINFMKVLRPIRQNAESIDEIDDDLTRMQKQIDDLNRELKKREENPPSSV